MRVITFYSDSAAAVSPTGRTLVGAKGLENVRLFKLPRLFETVKFCKIIKFRGLPKCRKYSLFF